MQRVLVTGVNGLVGGAIFAHLERTGAYSLIGTVREETQKQPPRNNAVFATFDLAREADLFALQASCGTLDAVVHVAAAVGKNLQSETLIDANCRGVLHCIALASSLGARRFVFISSIQVIGAPLSLPVTEDHPVNPQSLYHITKLFGEQALLLEENRPLHPAILRISSPLGPGMRPEGIASVFLRNASRNQDIVLHGKGGREQNYIDTRDIALAVDRALRTTATGVYNIAGVSAIANRDFAGLCKAVCRSSSTIAYSGREDAEEDVRWRIATGKAAAELGFTPRHTLEESLLHALSGGSRTEPVL